MIFVGGRVYAPGHPGATAVVIDGASISFVGSDDGRATAQRPGDQEVDLRGRLVTPAFVDAHVHLIQTGQAMTGLGLGDATSRVDALERVAAYARRHPQVQVIVGHGWDERAWPEPQPPTRTELDRAAAGVAVYLARVDVHSAVVSSTLLDQLPAVSTAVGYRSDGLLTREAHHLCRGSLDRLFTDQERRSAARIALRTAAAQGVAAVHELGGPHLGPIEDLTRVREVASEHWHRCDDVLGRAGHRADHRMGAARPGSRDWLAICASMAPSARIPPRLVSPMPMRTVVVLAICPNSRSLTM